MTTIEELLNSLISDTSNILNRLENNAETWKRIANKDSFSELNFSSESEKEQFLREWCAENPYNNI